MKMSLLRVLGIDPGLVSTGYAVIEGNGHVSRLCGAGALRLYGEIGERLKMIFEAISEVIEEYQPQEMAVETVFVHKSASSALKLGHARGVVICAGVLAGLPTHEYNTRYIKKAITGKGNANKEQIRFMTARLLQVAATESDDAADAMAIALCHTFAQSRSFNLMEELK